MITSLSCTSNDYNLRTCLSTQAHQERFGSMGIGARGAFALLDSYLFGVARKDPDPDPVGAKSVSQHLETIAKQKVGFLQGKRLTPGFFRCLRGFRNHPQYECGRATCFKGQPRRYLHVHGVFFVAVRSGNAGKTLADECVVLRGATPFFMYRSPLKRSTPFFM